MSFFETKIEFLKGVGPLRAAALNTELQIFTFGDLLQHFPFRHEDRSKFHKIAEIHEELPYVQIVGRLQYAETMGEGRKKRFTAYLRDDTGSLQLIWFQGATWIAKSLTVGETYVVLGKPSLFNGSFSINLSSTSGVLVFSRLGFKSQSITINGDVPALNIILEGDVSQLEDIIITANRTTQSSQKVAQSVSVLSSKTIQRNSVKEFRDYASGIPNLSFGSQGGDGGGRFSNEITIRGISGDNTTAMYLNGAPLPESINPNLIDISRIEVLNGPQGTLYGSATMGGAIKVITNKPDTYKTSGFIEGEFATVKEGNLDYNFQGLLNIPITKKIAFRGSGYYNFQSGIYDRVVNQNTEWLNEDTVLTEDFYGDTEDYFGNPFAIETNGCNGCSRENKENVDDKVNYGFNANLGFYPTDEISIIATVIHQKLEGDGYDFAERDVDSFIQNSNTGLDESFEDKWTNYSINAEFETTFGKFTSSTNFLD